MKEITLGFKQKLGAAARSPQRKKLLVVPMIAAIVLPFFYHQPVFATNTSPNGPSANASNTTVGTVAWLNRANASGTDGLFATNALASGVTGNYMALSGFSFGMDSNATINGIKVEIQRKSTTAASNSIKDNSIKVMKAGTIVGNNYADTSTAWGAALTTVNYGGSTDLWGSSWTPADIMDANFGVVISAKNVSTGGSTSLTASVDAVFITVYYSLHSILTQTSYRLFNNLDATTGGALDMDSASSYYSAGATTGLTMVDLNLDGHQEGVVTGATSNTVQVFPSLGNGRYGSRTEYATGASTAPESVTSGDFTSDGYPDVMVADSGSNKVSLFPGNGTTTALGTKVDFTVGTGPDCVIAADINADNRPDVVTANAGSNTVSVLLNDGTSTYLAIKQDTTTGSAPESVTAADFNADGNLDLATANSGTTTVSVLMGNGNGTFAAKVDYTVGTAPNGIVAGDFTGDGKPDLATANNGSNNVSVLINNGSGTFATHVDYAADTGTWGIVAADLNGDAKLDLVADTAGTLSLFKGNGNGTFATAVGESAGAAGRGIATGDADGDGGTDIFLADSALSYFFIFPNISNGSMNVGSPLAALNTAATVPGEGLPFRLRMDLRVTSGFLNNSYSQIYDLQYAPMTTSCDTAFSNTPSSAYATVTNSTPIRFSDNPGGNNGAIVSTNANDPTDGANSVNPAYYYDAANKGITTASPTSANQDAMFDFALTTSDVTAGTHYCLRLVSDSGTVLNGYATIPEIVVPGATYNQAAYRWYDNANVAGASGFATKVNYTTGTTPVGVATADFNGDSKLDLATVNQGTTTISVLLGTGTGTFGTKTDFSTGTGNNPASLVTADFNVDGKMDIATVSTNGGNVSIFLGNGSGGFATSVAYAVGSASPQDIAVGDLTNDGKLDLAVAAVPGSVGSVSVLSGNGDGTFNAGTAYALGNGISNVYSVVVGDLDGTGRLDMAVTSPNAVTVFLSSGAGTYNKTKFLIDGGARDVSAVDLNADSKLDLVVLADSSSEVSVFLNYGNGTYRAKTDYPTGVTGATSLAMVDVNGDGVLDIVAPGQSGAATSAILTGTGSGVYLAPVTIAAASDQAAVVAGDFNADGKTDVAVANLSANVVSVFLNATTANIGAAQAAAGRVGTMASLGTPVRLRLSIAVSEASLGSSGQSFKLQYGAKTSTCAAATYADVSTGTPIQWADNSNMTGGTEAVPVDLLSPQSGTYSNQAQTYQEANNFTNSKSAIYAGQAGLWDFSLTAPSGTRPGSYCLRAVTSAGAALGTYSAYPEVQFGPVMTQLMRGGKWFNQNGVKQTNFLGKY